MIENTRTHKNVVVGILTSPWAILVSVGIAAFIGVMFKDVAAKLRPFGNMYLYMIEMTVIPIIISAVVSSVAGLAKSKGVRLFLLRMIVVFILMLILVAVIGTAAGIIGHPGSGLDEQTRNTLGAVVKTSQSQYAPDLELSLSAPTERKTTPGILDFFIQMIPRNIFQSLSTGRALELIFFSIIFGVAIGVLGAKQGSPLIDIFDGLFKAFQKIISWLMVVLPFGLICLLADQIASTGVSILLAMMKFIIVFYAAGLGVFLIDVIIIWRRSRMSLGKTLRAMLDPIVISLVTRSSFATLPTAIKSLSQQLGYYERSTNLFLSLGVTLGRFGNILYFGVASLFVAQLYGADLGLTQYCIVAMGSLFAGIATAGASGIATLSLMSIVLTPLGLPLEAVLIIFIAIDTIADPLRTMLIVLTNMAANTLIVKRVDTLNRRTSEEVRSEATVSRDLPARVAGRGELIAVVDPRNAPPYYYESGPGAVQGLSVDCAKAIGEKLGAPVRFTRTVESVADAVKLLHDGEADILLGPCNFHKVFESELRYSEPYLSTREAMLADKNKLNAQRKGNENLVSSLRTYNGKVGVVVGSAHKDTAARVCPSAALESFATPEDLTDAVLCGDILCAFGDEAGLKAALEKRPAREQSLAIFPFSNLSADFRIGVAPKDEGVLGLINKVIGGRREPAPL